MDCAAGLVVIPALLFDLYETLVTERGTTPARAGSLGERLGLDPAAFRKAWRPQRLRVIRGQVSFADALVEIGTALGRAPDVRLVSALAEQRRLEKTALFQNIDPIALSALRHLRQRGCRLAIVSNCFAEDVAAWPECAASACFDASVFSFEVGAAKPEPRIYAEALRRLGVEPFHAAFIGDGGDDELLGAERAGLRAAQSAWFRGELAGLPPRMPRLPSWPAVLEFAGAGGAALP